MDKLMTSLLFLAAMVAATCALSCVSCDKTTCIPPPPGCELGRRVCSCCDECRVKEGDNCGAFSAECESHLVCFTNEGAFVGRPYYTSRATGRCVRYSDIPPTAAPQARVGRSIMRKILDPQA